MFLSLWLLGAIIVFSGLIIYLEFALNLPFKNGGEKNYLNRVFRKPRGLAGCIYAFQMVLLGFSSGNSFAFGKYVWFALTGIETNENDRVPKFIGVCCISFCIWLHIKFPNHGTSLFNFLGLLKIFILFLIITIGGLVAIGFIRLPKTIPTIIPTASSFNDSYSISVALLEIVYSFKGWENANYVLLEISDPYNVLTVAAPLAVLIVTVLYFFVIISYLIVIPKHELLNSGVLVAGVFFNKIFGENITSKILPFFIALSTLGNVMVVSFAHSYVNQDLARNNYLPFSKYFQKLNHSLLLHWFISVIVLIAPPSSEIYEFVVNLYIYPGTWINIAITSGLIYLRLNKKFEKWGEFKTSSGFDNERQPEDAQELNDESDATIVNTSNESYTEFDSLLSIENQSSKSNESNRKIISAPWVCIMIFLLANLFLALFPFIPPPVSSTHSIPYWCFPVVGTGALILGALFFFTRPWINRFTYEYFNIGQTDIKYEDDYDPNI